MSGPIGRKPKSGDVVRLGNGASYFILEVRKDGYSKDAPNFIGVALSGKLEVTMYPYWVKDYTSDGILHLVAENVDIGEAIMKALRKTGKL